MVDMSSIFGGGGMMGGGGDQSKAFGNSQATSTFDLGSGDTIGATDTSTAGMLQSSVLIGVLGLGLLVLLLVAIKIK